MMTIITKLSSSPASRVCPLHVVIFFSQKEPQQPHGNLGAEGKQTACYEKSTLKLCSNPLPCSLAIFRTLWLWLCPIVLPLALPPFQSFLSNLVNVCFCLYFYPMLMMTHVWFKTSIVKLLNFQFFGLGHLFNPPNLSIFVHREIVESILEMKKCLHFVSLCVT